MTNSEYAKISTETLLNEDLPWVNSGGLWYFKLILTSISLLVYWPLDENLWKSKAQVMLTLSIESQ